MPLLTRSAPLRLAALFLFAAGLRAAPIPVRSFTRDPDGATLRMNPGVLKLQVCEPGIVRVIYSTAGQLPPTQDFVFARNWGPVRFDVKEDAESIAILTGKLQVVVLRATGAIRFADAGGRTLLAEVADGGKSLTPAKVGTEPTHTVEQAFESPPGEALFGMGQFQDGLWDWRGVPLELRQLNTQVAVPMLVSSRGYGLLWNNASLLEFNPADRQVPLSKGSGTFTTGEAGDYVFFAKDGDRRDDFAIVVGGRQVAGVTNRWTPYSLSAKVALPAHTTVAVGLRGGGGRAKLFARPLGEATVFRSQMGEAIDYMFFYGPGLDAIVAGYRRATGAAPLWPRWAYGLWQCRERYSSQRQILDAVAEFRRRKIPVDVLVQDWQYWGPHGWAAYEWDRGAYPDPAEMIGELHREHVKFMISVWCDPAGKTRDDLAANKALLGDGWIDVFNPKGREIRWRHIDDAFFSIGTDAWWGDCSEPADDGEGIAWQTTALGFGGRVRNAYPLFANRSLYEGQRKADRGKRVCILTRSAYPGMQRYGAAVWSADIKGDWETFKRQIPAGLNFCLTGIPYWTTDCGGFFRPDGEYTSADYNELLARWFQWSTFCPILRVHGYQTETEMWKWLPETQKVLLAYDRFRHRMLPYTYSLAWKVTSEGYTMMRALPMDFPGDPTALAVSDEYLFGPSFLVAPVARPVAPGSASRAVYLPAGAAWVNFWTGERLAGGRHIAAAAPIETLPLFVRAGSIVPLGPVVQYAGEKPGAPVELRVYPGANGTFTLYDDEGDGYAYERGARATIPIRWDEGKQELTIGARQGRYPGMPERLTFRVVVVRRGAGTGMDPVAVPDAALVYVGSPIHFRP